MTNYLKYKVGLSDGQKKKLIRSIQKKTPLTLRLSHSQLSGGDELILTKTQINKIERSKRNRTGTDLRISLTQLRSQSGGNLFSSLIPIAKSLLPIIGKTAGLAGLSGLVSGGIEKLMKGDGLFSVPQDKVDKLIRYKDYLTEAQKKQINKALQTGSGISRFKLTKKQNGGFLGTLLASIGIPLLVKALTGQGLQVESNGLGRGLQVDSFLPENMVDVWVPPNTGRGKKKSKKGQGLIFGPNSPFKGIPLVGDLL